MYYSIEHINRLAIEDLTKYLNQLLIQTIKSQQKIISKLGFTPVIHFELEGCFLTQTKASKEIVDFKQLNKQLYKYGIQGEVVNEYWHNQWEFISAFNKQTPLQEAENLTSAIHYLPRIFSQFGIGKTLIQPVVWHGDQGQLAENCGEIFSNSNRAVHIPNAIQLNVSIQNADGKNLIADTQLGEYLQQCFLATSYDCSILYLPEPDAFERLLLKTKYGLAKELCSPTDISGGHQGSIALYRERGKHNQRMGAEPIVISTQHKPLIEQYCWQKTARVEHRLGASSRYYNAYINVAFALANVIDALTLFNSEKENGHSIGLNPMKKTELPATFMTNSRSFLGRDSYSSKGAVELFEQEQWFEQHINQCWQQEKPKNMQHSDVGAIIKKYYVTLLKRQNNLI